MKNPASEIENHRIPCGPVSVSASSLCRRRLRDHFDAIFDKLTKQIHPEAYLEGQDDEDEFDREGQREETPAEQKKRMIKEGKLKAEVKHEVEKYKEKLMGNSKLLQNRSGKIEKR